MSQNATSESTANIINKKSNELKSMKEQNDATGATSESDSDDEYYDDEWKENLESKGSMQKEKMMGIIKTFERKVREFCKTNSYYDWWNQEYPFYCKKIFEELHIMVQTQWKELTDTKTPVEWKILIGKVKSLEKTFRLIKWQIISMDKLSMFEQYCNLEDLNSKDPKTKKKERHLLLFNAVDKCFLCSKIFIFPDQEKRITTNENLPCSCGHKIMHLTCQKLYYEGT